jgi:succinoglycan biosynthesis protein ExoA
MSDSSTTMIVPSVTVIIAIRNESLHIEKTLSLIFDQDYPGPKMEVIVADGMSNDGTREILETCKRRYPNLRVLDNPGKIVSTGLNRALQLATGEIIVRVDGHTAIARDYVRQCVEELQRTGADNVGGKMSAFGDTNFGNAVALATSYPFGIGDARFHYSDREEWVDTVYMGAWRRETFNHLGGFDDELVRDQDDELNYRLKKSGGRIMLSPRIKSRYAVRSTPRLLWRQYFQYGYWKVRVLQKHPRQIRPRQLVPPVFVCALLSLLIFCALSGSGYVSFLLLVGAYAAANIVASLISGLGHGIQALLLLPVVYAMLHLSYGLGFLAGLIRFAGYWGKPTRTIPTISPLT